MHSKVVGCVNTSGRPNLDALISIEFYSIFCFSSMVLTVNGWANSGDVTRHFNGCYFLWNPCVANIFKLLNLGSSLHWHMIYFFMFDDWRFCISGNLSAFDDAPIVIMTISTFSKQCLFLFWTKRIKQMLGNLEENEKIYYDFLLTGFIYIHEVFEILILIVKPCIPFRESSR